MRYAELFARMKMTAHTTEDQDGKFVMLFRKDRGRC
jgi:hypothetical protein